MEVQQGTVFAKRFRILKRLNAGDLGVVYHAVDLDSGSQVALKTLLLVSEDNLDAVEREINALATLSHPGIVSIMAHGLVDGVPWCAMSYVAGETLRTVFARRAAGQEWVHDLPAVLKTFRGLAETLAYMHGERIVHRDLRAENVVIDGRGAPILTDFGLSCGGIGARVGTAPYVAPEVILHGTSDARTDIYALGCLLYEALAGRAPFEGDLGTMLRQQLNNTPVPLREWVRIPAELSALVHRMIEKDPAKRLSYATDIVERLIAIGADTPWKDDPPAPRMYLYPPHIRGRDHVLRELKQSVKDFGNGECLCTFVRSSDGMGKTRILARLLKNLDPDVVQIIKGEGRDARNGSGQPPLSVFAMLLRTILECCRNLRPDDLRRMMGDSACMLLPYEPGFGAFVGPATMASLLTPAEAQRHLFTCFANALAVASSFLPMVLVLDDLHHADDLSLAFLTYLVQERLAAPDMYVGVVAAYSSEDAPPVLQALAESTDVRLLTLDRLDDEAMDATVADMLAVPHAPAQLATFVHNACNGNPLFVTEYMRLALKRGLIARTGEDTWVMNVGIDSALGELHNEMDKGS